MENLFNFSVKKNFKQACLFYLATFLILLIVAFIIGALIPIFLGIENIEEATKAGSRFGQMFAIIAVGLLGVFILVKKTVTV